MKGTHSELTLVPIVPVGVRDRGLGGCSARGDSMLPLLDPLP